MKRILMASALVALLASPALAQSYDPDYGTGNTVQSQASSVDNSAFAYAPARARAKLQAGERAFAYANADSAVLSGAGSVGYNDKLLHD